MNQSISKIGRRLRSYVNRTLDLPLGILNSYFDRYTGGDNRPAFFDIDTTFPRSTALRNTAQRSRKILSRFYATDRR
jgi:hypothetical protein